MMVMMMEPSFFVWRKTNVCAPPPKKNTHACFWLFAGVKKTIVLMHNLVPLLEEQEKCLEGF